MQKTQTKPQTSDTLPPSDDAVTERYSRVELDAALRRMRDSVSAMRAEVAKLEK